MINFLALAAATLFAPPAPFSHLLSSPPRRTAHKIALIADSKPCRQATSTSSPPSKPKPHTHTIPAPAILAIFQSPIASRHRALVPPDSEVNHGSDAQAATAASMEAYCHGGSKHRCEGGRGTHAPPARPLSSHSVASSSYCGKQGQIQACGY
jgi:hypothetical protein